MPLCVGLLELAAALLCWPSGVRHGLPGSAQAASRVEGSERAGLRGSVVAGIGSSAATLLIWPTAFATAVLVGVVAAVAVRLLRSAPAGEGPRSDPAQLAILCELWAAGLDCGLAVGSGLWAALRATESVASTSPTDADSTISRLIRVASLLQIGADAARSWAPVDDDPALVPIAAAARRSSAAGVDLATTVREQARAIRRAAFGLAQRRAGRAGVLMTAPLALCFLPAFLCLGLAPVVIALINTLDLGR